MELRVNGESRQVSHSGNMSVTIPEILSHYSALGHRPATSSRPGRCPRRRLGGCGLALPAARRRDRGGDRADRWPPATGTGWRRRNNGEARAGARALVNAFREAFPILYVDDVEQAIGFYTATFGCKETFRHEQDGRVFAFLELVPLGLGVGLRPEGDESATSRSGCTPTTSTAPRRACGRRRRGGLAADRSALGRAPMHLRRPERPSRPCRDEAVSWPRTTPSSSASGARRGRYQLDALVVRAPDNVLYLTNFWGMKGYDAVVFPREGDPC